MNILKNMEAIFVATAVLACASATMIDGAAEARAQSVETFAAPAAMPVVVVSAKRMSADEKLQSMREERQLAAARNAVDRS